MNNKRFYTVLYCLKTYIFYRYNLTHIRIEQTNLKCPSSLRCTPSLSKYLVFCHELWCLQYLIPLSFTLFSSLFIFFFFLSYVVSFIFLGGSNHNSGNSHAPNVFCKLDDLWCSVWCRNISGRCHSLQSVEVQNSLQHEDQSVSMNGLVFCLHHAV